MQAVSGVFDQHYGILDWSVDLDNWEKVLRVEGKNITPAEILEMLRAMGVMAGQMET